MAFGENLIRGLKPAVQHLLVGDSLAIVLTWAPLDGVTFTRSGTLAAVILLAYLAVVLTTATASFVRRDLAGSS